MNANKLYDYVKLIGLLLGILAPGMTFYTVTKVQLGQQEIRITSLEAREQKIEQLQSEKFDKLIDAVADIKTDVAVIKSQVKR